MSGIVDKARVIHRNPLRSYGTGVVEEPGFNFTSVKFDGGDVRSVRTKDLIVIVTPAAMPGSRETARFCWPPERAGEPVLPGAA